MGVITIEVPQRVKMTYRINSKESANEVIEKLDQVTKKGRNVDLSDVLGIWADRPESAEEIARELRRKSNSRVKNG
jgi:hypothetical protein